MSTNTVPVYNPDAPWQIWNMKDVYSGPTGSGQYVPKVDDEAHQITGNIISRFICAAIDPTTMLPTMIPVKESSYEQDVQPADILFGVTPDTYRILIDTSVSPARMQLDSRLSMNSPTAQYCKVFVGTDISNQGTVISAWYNNSGQYIGENLPMILVATDRFANNVGVKVAQAGWSNALLADGVTVTAVFYDSEDFVVSFRRLLVQNTGFVRSTDAYAKAVVSIGLETPFLAAANSTIINYPVNVPLNALNLIGVVNYSDGTSVRYAVDGTRFSVAGLDAYAPTIVGQTCPITLKYRLQAGETAYGAQNGAVDHFSEEYTVVTSAVDGSYAVQLYCYPVWVNANAGYTLVWFLYDLNRSISYDVTGLVQIDTSVAAFQPSAYGVKQTLSVGVNLKNVNAIYNNFNHIQYVDIILNNVGTYRPARGALNLWQVTQQAGQVPMYGSGVHATFLQSAPGSCTVSLAGDFGTLADWKNAYYTLSRPLFNPAIETSAPEPTHFNIVVGGISTTYSISQWNAQIVLNQTLTNNSTLFIEFFKRTTSVDLQLSKVGVPLWQVNSLGSYI